MWESLLFYYYSLIALSFLALVWSGFVFYVKNYHLQSSSAHLNSRFLGLSFEWYGSVFYSVVFFSYSSSVFLSGAVLDVEWVFGLLVFSVLTTAISFYLVFDHRSLFGRFSLLNLSFAFINVLILVLVLLTSPTGDLATLIADNESVIVVAMGLALALGTGGSALMAVLFFKFLSDLVITREEYDVLSTIAQIIWTALLVVIFSAGVLFFIGGEAVMINRSVLVTILALAVITALAEVFLNLWIGPELVERSIFNRGRRVGHSTDIRRLGFALGAISVISWFSMMTVKLLRDTDIDLELLLAFYGLAVVVSVILSQVMNGSIGNNEDGQ